MATTTITTATNPASGNCSAVQSVPSGLVSLCKLSHTYSCQKNLDIALRQGCIPGAAASVAGIAIIVICIILMVYCYRKRSRSRNYRRVRVWRNEIGSEEAGESFHESVDLEDSPNKAQVEQDVQDFSDSVIQRNRERESCMKEEKKSVAELMEVHKFGSKRSDELPDLGSRLQKYWAIEKIRRPKKIIIYVKKSRQCCLDLNENEIKLLSTLFDHLKHPHLLCVHNISCSEEFVVICQDYAPKGSIRDYIFKATPTKDWCEKYTKNGEIRAFSKEEIAKCGYQILNAVDILYDLGITCIGQIHSGNVFLIEDRYVLGGYENSLLGYRTQCYQELSQKGLLDKIDVIMFGQLIYEMCTKKVADTLLPDSMEDLTDIQDPELAELVHFIFQTARESGNQKTLMKKISYHRFFMSFSVGQRIVKATPIRPPPPVIELLEKIFPPEISWNDILLKLKGKYTVEALPKLGRRTDKKWASATHTKTGEKGLLSAVEIPATCPVYVDTSRDAIQALLHIQHEFVLLPKIVDYVKIKKEDEKRRILVLFQDEIEEGSLRDFIYKTSPTAAGASKFTRSGGHRLTEEQVEEFGRQILSAMLFLSHLDKKENPLPLNHVHTGNIFIISGGKCQLGGFENSLLGYSARPPCDGSILAYENAGKFNAILFGHVIFQMCTGRELTSMKPTHRDYEDVPKKFLPVFKLIFKSESPDMKKIMELFKLDHTPQPATLSGNMESLLHTVRKNKPRDQDSIRGKGKHLFFGNLHRARK